MLISILNIEMSGVLSFVHVFALFYFIYLYVKNAAYVYPDHSTN